MSPRRRFLAGCAAALACPGVARAHGGIRAKQVGIVANPPQVAIIEEGLRSLGWRAGEDLNIVSKGATRLEQARAIMEEFVRLPVDVLVIFTDAAASVAVKVTRTVPIVMVTTGAVVEDGLVASLGRPDRNLTGLSFDAPKDLTGKRLALLRSMAPAITRVAFLIESIGEPGEHEGRATTPETLSAARALGITVFPVIFRTEEGLQPALATAKQGGADALLTSEGRILNFPAQQQLIHAFAARHRMPTLHSILTGAQTGGLMAYGLDVRAFIGRAAYFIDRILRGAKPSELPVEQPTRLELLLNRGTARALEIAIPKTLLLQADRVIE